MTAIVVVVNIFSFFYFFRIDLTRERRYTLTSATKDILGSLTKPVTITAYYSENSIPAIARARSEFKDMLVEYAARSGNKVVFNFINPNSNDSLAKVAQRIGIRFSKVPFRDKNEMKYVDIYLGAVVKMGDKTDVLPLIDPNSSLEYPLSNSIKKLSIDKKPVVGLLNGNGEPGLNEMPQVNESVSTLHALQEVRLSDSAAIPAEYTTLTLINPKDTFRPGQLRQLDAFLARGGRMLIAYSGLNPDFRTATGRIDNIGLTQWLAKNNIILDNKYIVDARCGFVTSGQYSIPFPFLPLINNFANHPVTKDLSSVMLSFASDIKFTGDTNKVKFTPIAFTSDETGLKEAPVTFDINYKWQKEEFPFTNLVIGAAINGVGGANDSRIVLISNGDFPVNGSGKQATKLEQGNVNLFSNALDWLSDNTGLIQLRSKVITFNRIKDVSDNKATFLKYLNFSLPLLLVILYGIIRMQVKKNLRKRRMEEII